MIPTNRQEFKDQVMRALGKGVRGVEVSEEQLDDRVDEALKYFWDYHFDGVDKSYFKYQVDANNRPHKLFDIMVHDGGTGYSNTDTVTFTSEDTRGSGAAASIVTDVTGSIIRFEITDHGSRYAVPPTATINTSTGSGASFTPRLGGFIPVPENIIGAIKIFDLSTSLSSHDMFSIQYQIALNELYNFTSVSMVPYYTTFQHVELIQQILIGQQNIRFVRHKNAVYLDTNWDRFVENQFLIVEAYEIVDPNVYADVWKDRWLIKYATALVKRQWGENIKKHGNIPMLGGVVFNGKEIFDEAVAEINQMEDEMMMSYSIMPLDEIG